MANKKWSGMDPPVNLQDGDEIVGLRGGENTRFNAISDTDTLPQGSENIYASEDGGDTDNLGGLPTIVGINTVISNLDNEITAHIDNLNNPHQTTLQRAFVAGNQIQLSALQSIDIKDENNLNISSVSQIGTQTHAPLIGLLSGQNILLSNAFSDIFFYNGASTSANQITLPLESISLFSVYSTFFAWRNGAQIFNIIASVGVTVNGIDGATFTLNPGQFVKFIRLDINTWVTLSSSSSGGVSSLNALIGDVNITSPTGTVSVNVSGNNIQLGVTGSDLACASYTIVGNTTMYNYFGISANYYLLLNPSGTLHNQSATNFTILTNSGAFGWTAVRYDGLTAEQFLITIDLNLGNINNTSGMDQQLNLSLGIGRIVSTAPVYTVISNNPKPLVLPQNPTSYSVFRSNNVNYQAVLTLNPGDIIYVVAESPTANPADNQTVMNYQSFSIINLKQALSVGSSGNTLQDGYNAGDGSITLSPGKPFQILNNLGDEILVINDDKSINLINNSGNWIPNFSNLVGLSSIVVDGCTYIKQNSILIYCLQVSFTVTDSSISFNHDFPTFMINNFTNVKQIKMMNQGAISSTTPTAADGKALSIRAVISSITALITATCAVGSGTYTLNISGMVEIQ